MLFRKKVMAGFEVNFTTLCQLERNYLEIANLHFCAHEAFSTSFDSDELFLVLAFFLIILRKLLTCTKENKRLK